MYTDTNDYSIITYEDSFFGVNKVLELENILREKKTLKL